MPTRRDPSIGRPFHLPFGDVNNVVFNCGAVLRGHEFRLC